MKALNRLIDTLEQYRPLFLARTRREKVLFSLFLVGIAVAWAGTFPGRIGDMLREVRLARQNISEQDTWFANRERIEQEYQAALASLDPAQLPPRQQVVAQLEGLARQSGLNPKIDPSTSTRSHPLTFHTINVSFDRVGYGKVAEFQRAAAAALPSVNLKTIVVSNPARVPGATDINVRLTYEAIEYIH